jgi:hypothetical protein
MEGKPRPHPRALHRAYTASRLEPQLLALAYECLWLRTARPPRRRPPAAHAATRSPVPCAPGEPAHG